MSHATRWVSDANRDAWQLHRAQRQQVSSTVSRSECFKELVVFFCFFLIRHGFADLILSVTSGIQVLLTLLFLVFYHRLNWILVPEESELAAVGSRRMLFPNCGGIPGSQDMPPSRGQSTVTDLGLGLQSLRLSGWDRPWSSQETDTHAPPSQHQASSPSMLGILNSPFSSILEKPSGYLSHDSMSMTADFLEKFPGIARMANRPDCSSLLDSRSSSPEDSETSGFSSGSDHLCDMLSTLRISPPLPYLASNVQKDLLRLGSRLDPQETSTPLTPPSSYASSTLSRRWRAGSPWPGSDMLDHSDEAFSIEREARLHRQAAGYVYLVFENEKSVRSLLQACSQDPFHPEDNREYYFKMSSRRMRCKDVQVIPWVISDSNYVRCPAQRLDPCKTVFVGALHGMLNAEALASIMNDLFGGVMYAGIDTDKHKYPIGSGRVTFNNQRSYLKAVSAAFVEIKTPKFTKKVQIDPYLEDSMCQICLRQPGPFFCRDQVSFSLFFQIKHGRFSAFVLYTQSAVKALDPGERSVAFLVFKAENLNVGVLVHINS
uniref:Cytoplasmic polyadenylation element binding protein 1b n=1 Tax=Oryzias latipes TaxID=8090 RepID=A0A3P9IQL6_ORYLA